jgi:hypothetical protein
MVTEVMVVLLRDDGVFALRRDFTGCASEMFFEVACNEGAWQKGLLYIHHVAKDLMRQ